MDGLRKEERAGLRTVIEVLNAQVALFNAQVNRAATRHNLIVAAYGLLASVGNLRMAELALTPAVYDPNINFEETRYRWGGLSINYSDGRREILSNPSNKQ